MPPTFAANLQKFDASLVPWTQAIAAFQAKYAGVAVATTEPVADYLLQAMGADNLTPFSFQADIMNGVDPAPQDISLENGFFTKHEVKVFCYNRQVVDALTQSILAQRPELPALPVVGVYETMPTPGYDYQTWMLAEVHDIERAVADGVSARRPVTDRAGPPLYRRGSRRRRHQRVAVGAARSSATSPSRSARASSPGSSAPTGPGRRRCCAPSSVFNDRPPGQVRVLGQIRTARREHSIGYVPQKVLLDPDIPMRAWDLVALGMDGHRFGLPLRSKTRTEAVDAMLRGG